MRIDATCLTAMPAAAPDPKLVDGARQFEAMLLGEMLKPLHFGSSPDQADDDAQTGTGGTIRGLGTEALAKSIAAHGGFGLARQILRQVTAEHRQQTINQGGTKVL